MTKLSYHQFLGVGHHVWSVNYSHGRHRNRNTRVQTGERDEAAVRKHRAFAGKRGLQIHSIEYKGVRGAPKESVEENVRWIGGYKNALAAHREDERDQRKPRAQSKRSPAPHEHDARRRTAARLAAELFKKHGRNEEMLGFRDHLDEARARSRGMNKGRPHQPAFISGDNLVGRVLDADERARVKRAEGRKSSPRRKPTMPRFSFSGKPIPEERVDEWTREQAAVRRAAKTVRERSGYSIRASVNIADTKTKGGTRGLRNLRGVRQWIRPAGTPFKEERVDELYGKGRFGEIRRHAQYMDDKHTVDRADAIVDDAGRERRAELRAKSRAKRRDE